MKKSELRQIIKEEIQNVELENKFNKFINDNYNAFLDTIGKEYEEVFSRRLFDVFKLYKEKFGKKHPLEFEFFNKTNLNESQKLNIQQEMKNLMGDILESNKKVKQLMKQKGYEI